MGRQEIGERKRVRVMSGKSEINGQTPEIRKNQNTRTW